MSVTQQDIADNLNISRSLVGRALCGHPEVAESTRQQIEAAARELGYNSNSNHGARQLISRRYGRRVKTNTLAVVFATMGSSPRRIPFFTSLMDGIEAAGEALDLDICACLVRTAELPRLIQTHSVDGVIMMGDVPQHIESMQKMGMPVVTFHGHNQHVHNITLDDRKGAYQATQHLLELGHREIAFLGHPYGNTSALRLQGYKDAMKEAGVAIQDAWINTSLAFHTAVADTYCAGCNECAACMGWQVLRDANGGSRTHRPNFSAIVCHNDPVAMGVIDHARRDGVEVPRHLSVTGFDDVSSQYQFEPVVTSIRFPRAEMGASAVRLLHQAIEAGEDARPSQLMFPTELAIHQSTTAIFA